MQNVRSTRLTLLSLLSLCTMLIANGQLLNGKYIGYEKFPLHASAGILAITGNQDKKMIKNEFYYKVKLTITDSFVHIRKVPVKFINDRLTKKIVDTTAGGYYEYSGKYRVSYIKGHAIIYGHIISCVACPEPTHGISIYAYISYSALQNGNDLILSSDNTNNILLKRERR